MKQNIKKAPLEAATSKSAENEHIQDKITTGQQRKQEDFPAAVVLDDVGTRLGMAISLCGLLAESLENEVPNDSSPAIALGARIDYYTDSLWILREFLLDIQKEARGASMFAIQ